MYAPFFVKNGIAFNQCFQAIQKQHITYPSYDLLSHFNFIKHVVFKSTKKQPSGVSRKCCDRRSRYWLIFYVCTLKLNSRRFPGNEKFG